MLQLPPPQHPSTPPTATKLWVFCQRPGGVTNTSPPKLDLGSVLQYAQLFLFVLSLHRSWRSGKILLQKVRVSRYAGRPHTLLHQSHAPPLPAYLDVHPPSSHSCRPGSRGLHRGSRTGVATPVKIWHRYSRSRLDDVETPCPAAVSEHPGQNGQL